MQTIANVKTIQVTNLEDATEAQVCGQIAIEIMTIRPGDPAFSVFLRYARDHKRPHIKLARAFGRIAAHNAILALGDPDAPRCCGVPMEGRPPCRSTPD